MKNPRPLPSTEREIAIIISPRDHAIHVSCRLGQQSIVSSEVYGIGNATVVRAIVDQFLNGEHTPEEK